MSGDQDRSDGWIDLGDSLKNIATIGLPAAQTQVDHRDLVVGVQCLANAVFSVVCQADAIGAFSQDVPERFAKVRIVIDNQYDRRIG